jgi:hypothetical protein
MRHFQEIHMTLPATMKALVYGGPGQKTWEGVGVIEDVGNAVSNLANAAQEKALKAIISNE